MNNSENQMKKESYTVEDVLVGMFANLPKQKRSYAHNSIKFGEFFYNNRDNYSILEDLSFDTDKVFPQSVELDNAELGLRNSRLLFSDAFFERDYISPSCRMRYENFSKEKFNDLEVKEIRDLSVRFAEEFLK